MSFLASTDELPEDDTLTPPTSKTGGIPLGMQAGAKAGGDLVDHERVASRSTPSGASQDRSDDLPDADHGGPDDGTDRAGG